MYYKGKRIEIMTIKIIKRSTYLAIILISFFINCTKKENTEPLKTTQIVIADHSDSLKTTGADSLFILYLVSAPKTYILNDLNITAGLPGQSKYILHFTLNDANGNNQFDNGESMICIEPGGNIFDPNHINKNINVYFREMQPNGIYFQAATGIWTPSN